MKRKLLLRAAEVLAKIPKKQFDLDMWLQSEEAEKRISKGKKVTKQIKCGTVACAGGWLGLTKEFNERGLMFYQDPLVDYPDVALVFKRKDGTVQFSTTDALAELFDISYEMASNLFSAAGYGDWDEKIIEKHGDEDISDRDLFQYRVKKAINLDKKGITW